MKDDKTYKSNDAAQTSLTVAKGYFTCLLYTSDAADE